MRQKKREHFIWQIQQQKSTEKNIYQQTTLYPLLELRRQICGTQTAQRYNYAFADGKLTSVLSTQCAHERLLENACILHVHVRVHGCVSQFCSTPSPRTHSCNGRHDVAGGPLQFSFRGGYRARPSVNWHDDDGDNIIRVLRFRGNKKNARRAVTLCHPARNSSPLDGQRVTRASRCTVSLANESQPARNRLATNLLRMCETSITYRIIYEES